jgi:hypothetical protein
MRLDLFFLSGENLLLHSYVTSPQFGNYTILRPPSRRRCNPLLRRTWPQPAGISTDESDSTTVFCDLPGSYTRYDWAGLDQLLSHPRFASILRLGISATEIWSLCKIMFVHAMWWKNLSPIPMCCPDSLAKFEYKLVIFRYPPSFKKGQGFVRDFL